MRIRIFDNGLRSATGHHFDYCLRLARCLILRGHTVSVWGAHGMQDVLFAAFRQCNCQPFALFSHFSHDATEPGTCTRQALETWAQVTASELASAEPADLSLFPTFTALQLAAWSRLEHGGPMAGLMHQPPEDDHPLGGALWAEAAGRVRARGLQVAIGAIDPLIGALLRGAGDALPVFDWPMPLDGSPKQHYLPQISTIGFFGYQRLERGITLIPALTDALLGAGYTILIHDTMGQFQPQAVIARLRLINGFVSDLGAAMAPCDLVVCTMQPERYRQRTSGIACTAVASGIPLVLPAGTLSAQRYQALGSVACYDGQTVQAVLQAVQTSGRDYTQRVQAAKRGAYTWHQTQGMERFVDAVLAAASPSTARPAAG